MQPDSCTFGAKYHSRVVVLQQLLTTEISAGHVVPTHLQLLIESPCAALPRQWTETDPEARMKRLFESH